MRVRLTDEQAAALRAHAAKEGRSVQQLARSAVDDSSPAPQVTSRQTGWPSKACDGSPIFCAGSASDAGTSRSSRRGASPGPPTARRSPWRFAGFVR
jgi:hypothetical protein